MKLSALLLMLVSIILLGCTQKEVSVDYNLNQDVQVEIFHNGVFSSFDGPDEIVGTMTATYTLAKYQVTADPFLQMTRQLVLDKSKGYHKNSMPFELSWRLPQVTLTSLQGRFDRVQSIRGYENFVGKVVPDLPIKEMFKRQLRDARYQLEFDRYEKRRWELNHLIGEQNVPVEGNITAILSQQGRLPIPSVTIDSVVANGFRNLDKRRCFEYWVYYAEREPFPYFMWEQHAYSTTSGKTLQEFKPDSASYHTQYSVALDPETGIPCQEREVKSGIFHLTNAQTQERAQFKVNVTLEHLYTVQKE